MNKRNKIYFITGVIVFVAIILKILLIELHKDKPVISFQNEANLNGISVAVEKITKKDYPIVDRVTAIPIESDKLESFVDLNLKNRIKPGQNFVAIYNGKEEKGVVSSVDLERDLRVGLYRVVLKLDKPLGNNLKNKYYVKINTMVLAERISVPNIALITENEKTYVWVVKENQVHKQLIAVDYPNGERTSVSDGLEENDDVVIKGMNNLFEGQKVRITECVNCK